MHAGGFRQVSRVSFLGRNGDDLTAVFEYGSLSRGRELG
jgi:hypothetical protein